MITVGNFIQSLMKLATSQIARFMEPTWGPTGSCWLQMGPMLAPWTLLSGISKSLIIHWFCSILLTVLLHSAHWSSLRWLLCQKQISTMGMIYYMPWNTVTCNCLSMPEIHGGCFKIMMLCKLYMNAFTWMRLILSSWLFMIGWQCFAFVIGT